jgi:acyl carrier protein
VDYPIPDPLNPAPEFLEIAGMIYHSDPIGDPMENTGEKIAEFIRRELSKDKQQNIGQETLFISSGLVDSFSLIRLLVFIEDEFSIVIPDEAATAEAMDSVALILGLMQKFGKLVHDG